MPAAASASAGTGPATRVRRPSGSRCHVPRSARVSRSSRWTRTPSPIGSAIAWRATASPTSMVHSHRAATSTSRTSDRAPSSDRDHDAPVLRAARGALGGSSSPDTGPVPRPTSSRQPVRTPDRSSTGTRRHQASPGARAAASAGLGIARPAGRTRTRGRRGARGPEWRRHRPWPTRHRRQARRGTAVPGARPSETSTRAIPPPAGGGRRAEMAVSGAPLIRGLRRCYSCRDRPSGRSRREVAKPVRIRHSPATVTVALRRKSGRRPRWMHDLREKGRHRR